MKDSALSTHSLLFCLRALNIERIQQNVMNRSDFGSPLKRRKKKTERKDLGRLERGQKEMSERANEKENRTGNSLYLHTLPGRHILTQPTFNSHLK